MTRSAVIRTIAAANIATALAAAACGDSSKGTRDDLFPYEKSRSGFGWGQVADCQSGCTAGEARRRVLRVGQHWFAAVRPVEAAEKQAAGSV